MMKVIITEKQLEQIRENTSKKFSCENKNCDHSWKIEKKDKHPYLCHMCGYDSAKEKHNYDELEKFWKNYKKKEEVTEKWSEKYKKSINCNNPKGFSQKAHCKGRKKKEIDEYGRSLKMARRQGAGIRFPKSAIKANPYRFRKYSRLKESDTEKPFSIQPYKDNLNLSKKYELLKEKVERDVNEYASNYEWCNGIEIDITETNWLKGKQKPVYEYKIKFKDYSRVSYEEQENLFDDIMFVHTMYFPVEKDNIDCYMSVKSVFPNGVERVFPNIVYYNEIISEAISSEDDLKRYGYDIKKVKQGIQMLSNISDTIGEYVPLEIKLYGYQLRTGSFDKRLELYIDVNKDDDVYYTLGKNWYDISNQLLQIFEMLGIRDEIHMRPIYDFKFNKRPLYNITIV